MLTGRYHSFSMHANIPAVLGLVSLSCSLRGQNLMHAKTRHNQYASKNDAIFIILYMLIYTSIRKIRNKMATNFFSSKAIPMQKRQKFIRFCFVFFYFCCFRFLYWCTFLYLFTLIYFIFSIHRFIFSTSLPKILFPLLIKINYFYEFEV